MSNIRVRNEARQGAQPLEEEVQLADVIDYIRQELIASETRRVEQGVLPIFEVESLDVEIKVV